MGEAGHVLAKTLIKDMCGSLRFMMGSYTEFEQEYAENCTMVLLRIIVEASEYVVDFVNDKDFSVSRIDQFQTSINEFRRQIRDTRLDFREAVAIRRITHNRKWSKSSNAFLSQMTDKLYRGSKGYRHIYQANVEASKSIAY